MARGKAKSESVSVKAKAFITPEIEAAIKICRDAGLIVINTNDKMSSEEASAIITLAARGGATKQQAECANMWLDNEGSGEKFKRHIFEVVHTYEPKK